MWGRTLLALCAFWGAAVAAGPLEVLVVVDQKGARSERIVGLLKKGGMAPKVAIYPEVTTRECDAADVVLADSRLFRKNASGALGRARSFPKTDSPIVAVGFLGTKLIQGHGIAMTSGYI